MSIIETLRAEALALRKGRSPIAASIAFAISEIQKVGKNNGNRATTEDEAVRVVQKLIATIDENLSLATDESRRIELSYERVILASVLPKMATDKDIIDFLRDILFSKTPETMPKKGEIMKALRDEFGASIDMKRAGQLLMKTYGV